MTVATVGSAVATVGSAPFERTDFSKARIDGASKQAETTDKSFVMLPRRAVK